MYDALNREIQVGDIITYPVRARSTMWTTIARVIEIEHPPVYDPTTGIRPAGGRIKVVKPDGRVACVTETERTTIAIRGTDLEVLGV